MHHTLYMDGPPHGHYVQFAMPTTSGALAAEVWGLPISSRDFGGPWDDVMLFASLPPHLFQQGFLHLLEWELSWGTNSLLTASAERAQNS